MSWLRAGNLVRERQTGGAAYIAAACHHGSGEWRSLVQGVVHRLGQELRVGLAWLLLPCTSTMCEQRRDSRPGGERLSTAVEKGSAAEVNAVSCWGAEQHPSNIALCCAWGRGWQRLPMFGWTCISNASCDECSRPLHACQVHHDHAAHDL
jgi:hypothetical protein